MREKYQGKIALFGPKEPDCPRSSGQEPARILAIQVVFFL